MPDVNRYPYVAKAGAVLVTRGEKIKVAAGTRLKTRGGNARKGYRRVELMTGTKKKGIMKRSHFKKA